MKMNKFKTILTQSGDKIKEQRADNVAQTVMLTMDNIIKTNELNLMGKRSKLTSMLDFGNETTYSLKVVKDTFVAEEWASEYLKLKVDIELAERELKIQRTAFAELFEEQKKGTVNESLGQ